MSSTPPRRSPAPTGPGAERERLVVFLCVANSARSQLAEALGRELAPPGVRVESAGSHPWRVHPMAVRVLAEAGLDISGARSKPVTEVPVASADTVITLCAEEVCPITPPGVRRLHWPFPDPSEAWSEPEQLARFRETRDALRERIAAFFAERFGTRASRPRPAE